MHPTPPLLHCSAWSTWLLRAQRWVGRESWEFLQGATSVWIQPPRRTWDRTQPSTGETDWGATVLASRTTAWSRFLFFVFSLASSRSSLALNTKTKTHFEPHGNSLWVSVWQCSPAKNSLGVAISRPQQLTTLFFLSTYVLEEWTQFSHRPQGVAKYPSETRLSLCLTLLSMQKWNHCSFPSFCCNYDYDYALIVVVYIILAYVVDMYHLVLHFNWILAKSLH